MNSVNQFILPRKCDSESIKGFLSRYTIYPGLQPTDLEQKIIKKMKKAYASLLEAIGAPFLKIDINDIHIVSEKIFKERIATENHVDHNALYCRPNAFHKDFFMQRVSADNNTDILYFIIYLATGFANHLALQRCIIFNEHAYISRSGFKKLCTRNGKSRMLYERWNKGVANLITIELLDIYSTLDSSFQIEKLDFPETYSDIFVVAAIMESPFLKRESYADSLRRILKEMMRGYMTGRTERFFSLLALNDKQYEMIRILKYTHTNEQCEMALEEYWPRVYKKYIDSGRRFSLVTYPWED